MAKRLARILSSFFRWMARQSLTSLVIVVGAVIGWSVRKATGPSLVSEQVTRRSAPAAVPRPAPAGTTDPVARAWLEEATNRTSPSGSLLALKRALDAGEISDFGRLARAMLIHPLPLFRKEALAALLPAWGEKDPAAAVRFANEYADDLLATNDDRAKLGVIVQGLGVAWAQRDPEAALRALPLDGDTHQRICEPGIWEGLRTPGAADRLGLIDRLKLVTSIRGEAQAHELLRSMDTDRWEQAGRAPSADEWRALAESTTSPELKARYQSHALADWRSQHGVQASAAEARAWMGQEMSPNVESFLAHMGSPSDMAGFLRSAAAGQLPDVAKDGLFGKLLREDPAQARALFQEQGVTAWVAPETLARGLQGKSEPEVRQWLGLLPDSEQRQEMLRQVLLPQSDTRTVQGLAATLEHALAFGVDGESLAVAALTERSRHLVQQIPDVFSSLPPEVQARNRLEVVLGLGERAPDVAAEIWLDATPGELGQPGSAVVAEEVAARLLRRDPEVGSAWIQQLPPGESRDRAVARMIEGAAAQDPATCAEWAATIVDPAARSRAAEALAKANSPSASR